jgi:hypothetical protein
MAFGGMLDKAKDSAKGAADKAKDSAKAAGEKAGNMTSVVTGMVDDINKALPILEEHGYKMNEFEVELGLVPSFKPHFSFSEELTEEKQAEILASLEGNKVASLLVKSLAQASRLQKSIKVGKLNFAEVEVEASVPPKVTLKFQ